MRNKDINGLYNHILTRDFIKILPNIKAIQYGNNKVTRYGDWFTYDNDEMAINIVNLVNELIL